MALISGVKGKKQPEFHEDGTPRSKYEPEERADKKVVTRLSIGFVIANALVLLKNVLFDSEKGQARASQDELLPSRKAVIADEIAMPADDSPADEHPSKDEDELAARKRGSGTAFNGNGADFQLDTAEKVASGRFGMPHAPGNDNESLYGAAPGKAIQLPGAGDRMSPLRAGGTNTSSEPSAGPGAVSDDDGPPGDDDGHTNEGPDGDEDTDPTRPPNRLPFALSPVILGALLVNEARAFTSQELLHNATDPDGDTLSVGDLRASSGTVQERADGTWMFVPEHGDTTSVTFTYLISDGVGTTQQTAYLDLIPTPAMGSATPGDDTLVGTLEDDELNGLAGNDVIIGREGNDIIFGGDGNDRIVAGGGNDVVDAGAGDDVVYAGAGDDIVLGGDGADVIAGDDGDDRLLGGAGNDTVAGGAGDDILSGGSGNDHLLADEGNDVVEGGAGSDNIAGGTGNDVVLAGLDADTVALDDGDDRVIAENNDGNDRYDGGAGEDTVDLSGVSGNASVDLTSGTSVSEETGTDTLVNFEHVKGGSGNDTLVGNAQDNILEGGAGDDVVLAGAGDDLIAGGDGNDTVVGEAGDDVVDGGGGADVAIGGDGRDAIHGGDGDDIITGNAGDDVILAGQGDDMVLAELNDGDDEYDGGAGSDTYNLGSTSADALIDLIEKRATSLEIGQDLIKGIENVRSGGGDDIIIADAHRNELYGGDGDDRFVFRKSDSIGRGPDSRDRILDFEVGDRLDFEDIREEFAENLEEAIEDQSIREFVLIRSQDEFTKPGQLKIKYEMIDEKTVTVLSGNTDYDPEAEFELELLGRHDLTDSDLYKHS